MPVLGSSVYLRLYGIFCLILEFSDEIPKSDRNVKIITGRILLSSENWHRKYHSGTICKGVSNPQASNALSGCEKEEIPK